ncbi:MAG: HAD family phosphatase [Bacteroidaceae bacterium]|nr:HAD family phosphatase [Bacteroidaceae bacterium]
MNDYKNIVFDLGGVVVDLDIPSSIQAFAKLGIVPQGVTLEELSRGGIPKDWEMREMMHAMDVGEMSADEFVALMLKAARPGTTRQNIVDAFNSIIRLPRHRLEWLKQLRRNHRVYLLSNIGELHWTETCRLAHEAGTDVEECFDEVFLSYRLRMAKPDPRIFQHLIEATGIVPEETLYIDDLPDNIRAGQAAGLRAHKIDCNALDEEIGNLFPEIL